MTGFSNSAAAICTLTVSASTMQKDLLLALISKVASPLQVKVDINSGKKPVPTELLVLNSAVKLKQRSSILRALCGAGLLNALDGAPYYLLGGHATPGSPKESLALASISSWMSVASSLKNPDDVFFQQLNGHLETRAFLTPSSNCTVADLDVALKLMTNADAYNYPHVQRWLRQCHAVCTRMAQGSDVVIPTLPVPEHTAPSAPLFFYELDESAMPKAKKQQQPAAGGAKGKGKDCAQQQQQQQKQGKKEKNKGDKPAKAPAPAAAEYDISALDIRVGKINKIWEHKEADKLFCEEIDVGEEGGPRNIASGLRPFYKTDQLEGKMVLVLANLKPMNMLGFSSHGMVLCSSNADHTQVEIVQPPEGSKIGERVEFDGFGGKEPEPQNKVNKKKIFQTLAPDLKTTADGVVVWKDAQAKTSAGIVKGMPNGQVA